MKIRQGFVSNSSSSSFVIVFDKEVFNKIRPTLDPFDAFFVKEAFSSGSCLGKKCLSFSELTVQDYSYWDEYAMSDLKEKAKEQKVKVPDGWLSVGEITGRVSKVMIKEDKDSVFSEHMDG